MSPQTIVVTGANRGIGYAVAEQLVARGAHVVLLVRDRARGDQARQALTARGPGTVSLVLGDLGTVGDAHAAAAALRDACPRIDVLVHNAGVWPSRREVDEQGLERAFVVNHLAPFVLNHALSPRLCAARARVVQVSAGLYVKGRPDPARTPFGQDFHPLGTYPTTKLCNLLLMPLFAERWRGLGVTINAVHPGVIRTGLGEREGALGLLLRAVKRLWKSPEEGARPVVRLATDPALEGVTGRYFHLETETPLLPVAADRGMAERLWEQARALTGVGELEGADGEAAAG